MIQAFGIVFAALFLLIGPASLTWLTSSSPTAVQLRTFVDTGRTADSLLPLLGEEQESGTRDGGDARKRHRTVSGGKPGITNYLIIGGPHRRCDVVCPATTCRLTDPCTRDRRDVRTQSRCRPWISWASRFTPTAPRAAGWLRSWCGA